MKKAFTMIELVMVMVIMGIVASIGADIIASMYMNYLRSRTINALESKTEIILEQIAKRLQYRIKDSVIARKSSDATLLPLPAYDGSDTQYNILEWIGYSNESFLGTPRPGWSGFIDLDSIIDTNKTAGTLKTPESNLTDAAATMLALTNNINLTDGNESALIFKGIAYNASDFGWGSPNSDGIATLKVRRSADDIFQVSNDTNILPDEISEQYYLSHTAYAIVPTDINATTGFFNLNLHYNYQPWLNTNTNYTDVSGSILAQNVSLFRFKEDESVLRLKLCLHDDNKTGTDDYIVICKEKVVY